MLEEEAVATLFIMVHHIVKMMAVAEAEASEAVALPIRAADITAIRTGPRAADPQGVGLRVAVVAEGVAAIET